MSCDWQPELLATYLDGELASDEATPLLQHLQECPHCAARIAEIVSIRRRLSAAKTRFTPDPAFKRRVQQGIAPERKKKSFPLQWVAVAACLALMVATFEWRQYSVRSEALREVADLHISALASANPVDVVSTDRHTVKPWFQGRIPFTFNLPEFGGTGFNLLGGKVVYLQQQPAAQLIVAMNQHKISVLILKETGESSRLFAFPGGLQNRDTFNTTTWVSHGLRFAVVGDAEAVRIEQLADLMKQANI